MFTVKNKKLTRYAQRKLWECIHQLRHTVPPAGAVVVVKRGMHYGKLGLVAHARILEFNYQGNVGVTGPVKHPKLHVLVSSTEMIWLHPWQVDQIDLDYYLMNEWMLVWYRNRRRR